MKVNKQNSNLDLKKQLRVCENRYKELKKNAFEDQKKAQEFTRRILFEQEQERKSISRELHDEIAQLLTGVNFYLGALSKEASVAERSLHDKITSTQQLIIDSVDAVYLFAKELRPLILDDLGLVAALKSHIKDFTKYTSIPVDLNVPPKGLRLSEFNKTILFRIVQEALANVRKHAKATQVSIELKRANDCIHLSIMDNGVSFNVNRIDKKRMGITGMRERIRLANGTITITSDAKSGTKIMIAVPLKKGATN